MTAGCNVPGRFATTLKVNPQTKVWLDSFLTYLHESGTFHEYADAIAGAQSENFIWAPVLSSFGHSLECQQSGQWVIVAPGTDSDHELILDGCVGSPKIPNVATCSSVPRYYDLFSKTDVQ